MKGNDQVLNALNEMLVDELTAINQYMVHSEMCAGWGYHKLHEAAEKRAIVEMKHAEKLIGRILFLEGIPIVSELKKIHIGADVKSQLENDREAEVGAVLGYNGAIKTCIDNSDFGSRSLLEAILGDEEDHLDWLESQFDQIKHMGIESYLGSQLE
jgi:bacterioferritin